MGFRILIIPAATRTSTVTISAHSKPVIPLSAVKSVTCTALVIGPGYGAGVKVAYITVTVGRGVRVGVGDWASAGVDSANSRITNRNIAKITFFMVSFQIWVVAFRTDVLAIRLVVLCQLVASIAVEYHPVINRIIVDGGQFNHSHCIHPSCNNLGSSQSHHHTPSIPPYSIPRSPGSLAIQLVSQMACCCGTSFR